MDLAPTHLFVPAPCHSCVLSHPQQFPFVPTCLILRRQRSSFRHSFSLGFETIATLLFGASMSTTDFTFVSTDRFHLRML